MFKLFRQRRETFARVDKQPCPADCGEGAQRKIRQMALDELGRAGLIGHRLDRLQQAEIALKVSQRLLQEDTEGRRSP